MATGGAWAECPVPGGPARTRRPGLPNRPAATRHHLAVTEPTLTVRQLNRALLERQLLLERSDIGMVEAIEQVGGLQTQYAPSGYVGLWTRLAAFQRHDLTRAIEDRRVIQATLLRGTIHMVSRREYWRYALGVRKARRDWWLRLQAGARPERDILAAADRLRAALADGPKTVKELGDLATGFLGNLSLFVDLVRVPPSGTWERRRADRLGLAEDWVGPVDATERDGMEHLVRAYLRAFGPATWRDISAWAGVSVTALKESATELDLAAYRDDNGRALVDLTDLSIPDPKAPAPIRFLPHWDANLLVHARRTAILPEDHRPRVFQVRNPFSVGTVLLDGRVVSAWSVRDGRVVLDPYESLSPRQSAEIELEREALEAFHR